MALAVRLVHLWQLRSSPFADILLGDAKAYDEWAQRIAAGDWLGRDVFYQAPLYPYLLGAFYALVGHDLMLVRLVQAVASASACLFLASATRRLFSPRAGLIAGLTLAICAPVIFADGLLQKSSLDLLLLCSGLWVLSSLTSQRAPLRQWLALGSILGALSLTRENSLILLAPLLAWVASERHASYAVRTSRGLCLLLGVGLLMAPVAIRNAVVGHGFYPTTAQFGPNLYIGNHLGASGRYEPLRPGRGTPEFERLDATDLAQAAVGRSLTPAEVSRYWTTQSLRFVLSDPMDWARVTFRKGLLLLNRAEIADTESQESHAEWSAVLTVLGPLTNFGVLIPLACVGAWIVRRRWLEIWIVPALAMTYAISVLAFYVLARYRYPLIPFLAMFSAAGLTEWPATWRLTAPRQRGMIGAALASVLIITNWPLIAANSPRALTENTLGTALQVNGRLDEALKHYQAAIALDGSFADAYLNAGTVFAATNRPGDARTAFETALTLEPESGRAHYFLGKILREEGQTPDGIVHLQRAAQLMPDAEEVHTELAVALADAGQMEPAIAQFREAVRTAPTKARTHWNLGLALTNTGAPAEGATRLRRAVELDGSNGELRADFAWALLQDGDVARAVREFRASVALTPPNSDTLNRIGIALAQYGELPAAIEAFRAAIAVQPEFEDAQSNLAAALARLGSGVR